MNVQELNQKLSELELELDRIAAIEPEATRMKQAVQLHASLSRVGSGLDDLDESAPEMRARFKAIATRLLTDVFGIPSEVLP